MIEQLNDRHLWFSAEQTLVTLFCMWDFEECTDVSNFFVTSSRFFVCFRMRRRSTKSVGVALSTARRLILVIFSDGEQGLVGTSTILNGSSRPQFHDYHFSAFAMGMRTETVRLHVLIIVFISAWCLCWLQVSPSRRVDAEMKPCDSV